MPFNKVNNHNLGAWYIYQWWLSLMVKTLVAGKYSPSIQGIKVRKPIDLKRKRGRPDADHAVEYKYAKAIVGILEEINGVHESIPFVEWEDHHLEDINILSRFKSDSKHCQILLIQSKTAAKGDLTKATLLWALEKFSKNKNLEDHIVKNGQGQFYLQPSEVWRKMKFYIITNWEVAKDASPLAGYLSDRTTKAYFRLANETETLFKKMSGIPTRSGTKMWNPIGSGRLTSNIKSIIQHLHRCQWNNADRVWNLMVNEINTLTIGDFGPHNLQYKDLLNAIIILENTVVVQNLDFSYLKSDMKKTFKSNSAAANAFYKIAEISVSMDGPNTRQLKCSKKFDNVLFSTAQPPGVLKNQGKFLI